MAVAALSTSPSPSCLRSIIAPRYPNLRSFSSSLFASSSSSSSSTSPSPFPPIPSRGNYAGVRFEETVGAGSERSRLDAWVCSRLEGVSRARVQSSIRFGLVLVNGKPVSKVSYVVKAGDKVSCTIAELQQLRAEPEEIPMDIVYEDEHLLVVNKPAHMVVHPAPGNSKGTLVNGILHHCKIQIGEMYYEAKDSSDGEFDNLGGDEDCSGELYFTSSTASIRPGIVHRLDKGTSGLLVVAKDEHSHTHLSQQFKVHSINRVYISLACSVPAPSSGRIQMPIARDPNNRIRMAAVSHAHRKARHAASRYKVMELLAGDAFSLVEWRLETGRTHQIRAHAKYMGIPLLGDEVYGGTKDKALSLLRPRIRSDNLGRLSQYVSKLNRPCLHAMSLGFKHPHTDENMSFNCPPPADFTEFLSVLRSIK